MDILEHLTEEHRKAEALISQLSKTKPGNERDELVDQLEEALSTHMAVEENFLYPIVEQAVGSEEAEEANIEHGLAREGLAKLRELSAKPGFGAALDMVKGGIEHHVEEEETHLFPELREKAAERIDQLDPEKLEAVATATREELYRKAKEAGVPGRSDMTKEELAEAVSATRR